MHRSFEMPRVEQTCLSADSSLYNLIFQVEQNAVFCTIYLQSADKSKSGYPRLPLVHTTLICYQIREIYQWGCETSSFQGAK